MDTYVEQPRLVTVVLTVRAGLTAAVVALMAAVLSLGWGAREQPMVPPADIDLSGEYGELFAQHNCSPTGFAPGVIPTRAVVRFDGGRTEVVTFDRGWDAFTGAAPGEFLAVCLGAG